MSALHSTENFETGTNGTEISLKRFQEIRKLLTFRNVDSQPKTPKIQGGKSIATEISCVKLPKILVHFVRLSSFPENPKNAVPFVTRTFRKFKLEIFMIIEWKGSKLPLCY